MLCLISCQVQAGEKEDWFKAASNDKPAKPNFESTFAWKWLSPCPTMPRKGYLSHMKMEAIHGVVLYINGKTWWSIIRFDVC